ncbi:MAG: DUF1761 domain-containing protein [Pseudohongiellaceae bacterium]
MFDEINLFAVLAAAISSFAVGGIWYGPLFGKAWMEAFNITEQDLSEGNMPMIYGLAFLLSLVAALNLAFFFGSEVDTVSGIAYGFATGLGWVAAFTGIQYLFEGRSLKAFLINAGYSVVALTVMGGILGTW